MCLTLIVPLMKNAVVVNVLKVPIALVIPVRWSPNVPLMKHVVVVNALKRIVASVKVVMMTLIVQADSRAAIGHAQVAQIASANLVPATAIVKHGNIVVKAHVKTQNASAIFVLRTLNVLLMQNAVIINVFEVPIAPVIPV